MGALSDPPLPPWALRSGRDGCSPWAVFAVGSVEHRLRWVAPGSFTMGSPIGELGRFEHEAQHHVVLTQGYWLGETPVTQDLWRAVMGTERAGFRGDRRPVECVRWHDAMAFCAAANVRVPGLALTLPTEAEWEYACRAGTSTATWNGDLSGTLVAPELDGVAWYAENSGDESHPVGALRANPWGFHDMLGNVREWCADAWGEVCGDAVDPLRRGDEGAPRVMRGGSWYDRASAQRAASRYAEPPGYRHDDVGFRVALGRAARP